MSNTRKKRFKKISVHLSATNDGSEARFLQVGTSLIHSQAFNELSPMTRWVYFVLADVAAGKRSGFELSRGRAESEYHISHGSFQRGIRELEKRGFIEVVTSGERGQFETTQYAFSSRWKAEAAAHNGA